MRWATMFDNSLCTSITRVREISGEMHLICGRKRPTPCEANLLKNNRFILSKQISYVIVSMRLRCCICEICESDQIGLQTTLDLPVRINGYKLLGYRSTPLIHVLKSSPSHDLHSWRRIRGCREVHEGALIGQGGRGWIKERKRKEIKIKEIK